MKAITTETLEAVERNIDACVDFFSGIEKGDYPFEWFEERFGSVIGPAQKLGFKRQEGEWSEDQAKFLIEYAIDYLFDEALA